MDGVLNIDKPLGITSFDVVARVRRLTGIKKVGHTGTLDPDAGGVLPVCVGKATKIIEYLMEKDKAYCVGLLLGVSSETQDSSGKIIYEKSVEASFEEIEKTILSFKNIKEQIPPMYSAVRVNGKRLYELAREGIEIERKPRAVSIYQISIKKMERIADKVSVIMDVECSKGTYMRTLCHDIGEAIGCGGLMDSLVRTRSGPFEIDKSYTLEALEELKLEDKLKSAFISPDQALPSFPSVVLTNSDAIKLRNGLTLNTMSEKGFYRLYNEDGSFLAIGNVTEREGIKVLKSHKWLSN